MNWLDRGLAGVERALGWIAKAALVAMMILIVADAGGRYLFDSPVSGVYEITEFYLMMALVFLSLGLTARQGGHVRADIFFDQFPPRAQRRLEVIYLAATMIVFALIAYAIGRASVMHIEANRWTTGAVPLPTGPSWAIASLGAGALSLRLALQMVSILRGGPIPRHGIEGAPPAAEEPATGCNGREG